MPFSNLIKNSLRKIYLILIKNYKPLDNPLSIKLVPIIAVLPFAGFIYLVSYMFKFGIGYDSLYFNVNDCITVLYQKGILFYMVILFIAGASLPLISVIINFFRQDEEREEFKNWQVLLVSILYLGIIIFTFYKLKTIPQEGIFWLSFTMLLATLVYLFKSKIEGLLLSVICFTSFCILYAINDAENRKIEKLKFDIVIKEERRPLKILSETDSCQYLIKKTSDYIFIMNYCENKVKTYPASDLKFISFTPKK
ncbi:hypothetical protein [Chryseobacterium sp. JV274]|uniref:hypothetical protein n=1 Tax=Chryseobacterium sp. JV274 TaxID=1932669 RepID=UPI0015C1DC95|nr:hypothetical protein [Chryseobacterium sp. JV274]CAD0221522.1 conserved membrane protein of unknown function [Chryseobacterium sp. JV274]